MKAQIFLTGLAIVALTTFATAQNPQGGRGNRNCNSTGKGVAFIDINKDGICDNFGTSKSDLRKGKRDGSGNGQGQGNNSGMRQGSGNGSCRRF